MIRCRFTTPMLDYRPINWPIKHPYWCTGTSDDSHIIVAYADNEEEILNNWPEAENLDSTEVQEYVFTDRFQKPDWFEEPFKDQP